MSERIYEQQKLAHEAYHAAVKYLWFSGWRREKLGSRWWWKPGWEEGTLGWALERQLDADGIDQRKPTDGEADQPGEYWG